MLTRPPSHPQLRWQDLRSQGQGVHWRALDVPERLLPTYTGRAAIYQALAALRRSAQPEPGRTTVLVPAFHCPTVVDPVIDAGYRVRFYGIDEHLDIDREDFLRKLDRDVAAVVFIRYFGVTQVSEELRRAVRECGAWLVDDCSHSFLLANPVRLAQWQGDATTYSFWKLLPSMSGGGLLFANVEGLRSAEATEQPPLRSSVQLARGMLDQLTEGAQKSARRALVNLHLRAPAREPTPAPVVRRSAAEAYPYIAAESRWRIASLAERVLQGADLNQVVEQRRRNFETLASALEVNTELEPLWRGLDREAVPWGFPVLLRKRQERDYLIRARGVPVFSFGEVLHPLLFTQSGAESRMVEASRYLSDTLLVMSIHQGLSAAQVAHGAELVNEFFADATRAMRIAS